MRRKNLDNVKLQIQSEDLNHQCPCCCLKHLQFGGSQIHCSNSASFAL